MPYFEPRNKGYTNPLIPRKTSKRKLIPTRLSNSTEDLDSWFYNSKVI